MRKTLWLVIGLLVVALVVLAGYALLSSGRLAAGAVPVTETADALPPEQAETAESSTTETLVLLHTNDFHGAIEPKAQGSESGEPGGLVNLISLIDQIRAENPGRTLLLDAGDTFQGTYLSNSTQGEVVMAAMNVAGYDAWVLGNHEFDWGQELLRARIAQADFPALGANIADASTGATWGPVDPYTLVEVGQVTVAILGLAYPDTPVITKAANVAGLDFKAAEETVRRYLPDLEEQADLIVVLSHLGYDGDQALAAAVDGIDIIVGGHTHTYLEQPRRVNETLIAQAGANGQVLGRLDLALDMETGKVTAGSRSGALLPVTGDLVVANAEVQSLVDGALEKAAETMNQPVGKTARALQTQPSGEFALGNLVVDAMLAADLSDGTQADIAMHNNGGIRAALPKGQVTYGQLYAALPFDNQLMALDLTGRQVLQILEHSVAQQPGKMQVAGLAFRFDPASPAGQRVVEATVGGKPLDPDETYRVVTIDYLAGGGDGQATFLEGTNPTYGEAEVWVVAEYIRAHSPVAPRVEGRITRE